MTRQNARSRPIRAVSRRGYADTRTPRNRAKRKETAPNAKQAALSGGSCYGSDGWSDASAGQQREKRNHGGGDNQGHGDGD